MKILHLIDSGGFYGAEAVLLELVKEQRKQGMDAQICSIGTLYDKEKPIEKICRTENVPVHLFRMRAGPNLVGALKILSFAKKDKFDILHSHGYKANILFGLLPSFVRKMPYVITLHGWTSIKYWTKIWFYEKLDSLLLSRAAGIAVVSETMCSHPAIKGKTLQKLSVIQNGISTELPEIPYNDLSKKLRFLKQSAPVVGAIGRLSYEKGYDVLLAAWPHVLKKIPGAHLVIMGTGRLRDEFMEQASKLGIEKSVWFVGYVQHASQYIPLFDVFVNSSRTEGLPITLLECMRAECPIVATQVGGIPSLLEHGQLGQLVAADEPEELSQGISSTLLSKEPFEQAKLSFIRLYSSAAMANKYSSFYQKALAHD